jgi:predicted DNA binding CopG/RHH family protein
MKRKASKVKYGKIEVPENPFDPKTTKIKVTSWFDADLILMLKEKAAQEGTKYQTLMNHLLREAVMKHMSIEQRLEKIERTLKIKTG